MDKMLEKYRGQIGNKTADVIYRLVKRSRLPRNRPVYEPREIDPKKISGYKGPKSISMFELSLIVGEFHDAYIGRFLFYDQQSLTEPSLLPECVFKRDTGKQVVDNIRIPIKDKIVDFYFEFLDKICEDKDDPTKEGEVVKADCEVVQHVNDRLVHGKIIAESKLKDPDYSDAIKSNINSPGKLSEILRDPSREEVVVAEARKIAQACNFNPNYAEEFVRWMMGITLRVVEVQYLQKKLA